MGTGIGVDGCRAGWLAIRIEADGGVAWGVHGDVRALHAAWYRPGTVILVDIPIGLPDTESHRACDRAARVLLGRRASSVFNPPTRAALQAGSWEEAARLNAAACGKRLSRQSWALAPKIREVDDFIRRGGPGRQDEVRESHPETLFVVLNGGKALEHGKKGPAGQRERLAVLEGHHPGVLDIYHAALRDLPRRAVARDDVLDALAAAVVAHRYGDTLRTLPDRPDRDSCGLIREIVVPRVG